MSEKREQEIQEIHKKYAGFYDFLRGSSIVAILLIFGAYLFAMKLLDDYTTNVFTGLIDVIATVLIIDRLNARRTEQERKEELIFQLGSEDNSTALAAARMLRYKGWLEDGSLMGIHLLRANLQGANLLGADLASAVLWQANLQNAILESINLQDAVLWMANLDSTVLIEGANLKRAELGGATFTNSTLIGVDLQYAELTNVNLEATVIIGSKCKKANFEKANLAGVLLTNSDLEGANFIGSILPDGTEWTEGTDMERFTSPSHPEFEMTFKKVEEIRKELGYPKVRLSPKWV